MSSKISLNSIAHFTWGFGQEFLLEIDGEFYVWSDRDYDGDNVITRYEGNPGDFTQPGFKGRDKGLHSILDYCGSDVLFLSC